MVENGKLLSPTTHDKDRHANEMAVTSMLERAQDSNVLPWQLVEIYYNGVKGLQQSPADAHWWWKRALDRETYYEGK